MEDVYPWLGAAALGLLSLVQAYLLKVKGQTSTPVVSFLMGLIRAAEVKKREAQTVADVSEVLAGNAEHREILAKSLKASETAAP